jgi:ribonuclease BN (tRNA processing enzyme)
MSRTMRRPRRHDQAEGELHAMPHSSPVFPARTGERLQARFWGVRGSRPVAAGGSAGYGGNTACVELRYGRHTLILDAGSGIVALGERLMRTWASQRGQEHGTLTLLFSHAHHDHLCGLPFFAPLFDASAELHLLGPDLAGLSFEAIVAGYLRAPYFPVDFYELPSRRHLASLADGARLFWRAGSVEPERDTEGGAIPAGALVVDVLHAGLHPRDGTLVYRISAGGHSLVYATDVEIANVCSPAAQRLIRFARGADVLIHDAQYSEDDYAGPVPHRGYGHSTATMAARVARSAEVGQLLLFHHDPSYQDLAVSALEHAARQIFPASRAAREGQEICLDGTGTGHV